MIPALRLPLPTRPRHWLLLLAAVLLAVGAWAVVTVDCVSAERETRALEHRAALSAGLTVRTPALQELSWTGAPVSVSTATAAACSLRVAEAKSAPVMCVDLPDFASAQPAPAVQQAALRSHLPLALAHDFEQAPRERLLKPPITA